ncbi:unnamed protein product [Prunus armeniaca]|uniref:Uncharacterized protein n=1 Tax=Prunus armeniaca TaxID=36596 RepID=A0A6J5VDZ1_PRUAR|nr:unnamed protein product [Prunus armeniaca]CAB4316492.1 unnamed protein product [Prunus armeniaca]
MADYEGKVVATDVTSGSMIFEPIIEDGVFRFDCSANDRNAAYPSISFINSKDRDTPIMSHKIPSYIPNFQCLLGQQIVKLEVSNRFSNRNVFSFLNMAAPIFALFMFATHNMGTW